ncbi:MAG TPA: hypothetical protein VIS51_08305 [Solirubrobacterales bacterium]
MIPLRPRDLFDASFHRWITQSVKISPLFLLGPLGSGAEDLAWAQIEQKKGSVLLRPTVGASTEEIVADLVAHIVHAIEPRGVDALDWSSPAARGANVELARRYGPAASKALEIAAGSDIGDWTLSEAMGLSAKRESLPPVAISIVNVHRVPTQLLWELRDLVNAGRATLVATTHKEHVKRVFGAESAFYGNATIIEVPEVDPRMCEDRLREPISPSDLQYLLLASRGRAGVIIEVLSYWEPGHTIQSAWANAVSTRRHEAENVLNLAAGVHAYAPRLLIALARHQAPYGAIHDAPSQRVARALAKLRDTDLIEQPAQRTWWIADPLLQDALASHAKGASAERHALRVGPG